MDQHLSFWTGDMAPCAEVAPIPFVLFECEGGRRPLCRGRSLSRDQCGRTRGRQLARVRGVVEPKRKLELTSAAGVRQDSHADGPSACELDCGARAAPVEENVLPADPGPTVELQVTSNLFDGLLRSALSNVAKDMEEYDLDVGDFNDDIDYGCDSEAGIDGDDDDVISLQSEDVFRAQDLLVELSPALDFPITSSSPAQASASSPLHRRAPSGCASPSPAGRLRPQNKDAVRAFRLDMDEVDVDTDVDASSRPPSVTQQYTALGAEIFSFDDSPRDARVPRCRGPTKARVVLPRPSPHECLEGLVPVPPSLPRTNSRNTFKQKLLTAVSRASSEERLRVPQ